MTRDCHMKILVWRDPGLVVGKAQGSSAWEGALRKVGTISGLQKKSPEWRPFFDSSLAGVQENG